MKIKIFRDCPFCGKPSTVLVDADKYITWIKGQGLIQNIFPELTSDERECLLSGICKDCFPTM